MSLMPAMTRKGASKQQVSDSPRIRPARFTFPGSIRWYCPAAFKDGSNYDYQG